MRCPSEKRLMAELGLSKAKAHYIRKVMKGQVEQQQLHRLTQAWVRQCYHTPRWPELAMHTIDCVLGNHGVECIRAKDILDDYHGDVALDFSNTGDSYAATILYDTQKGNYLLSSWGDIVEAHPERYC